MPAPRSDADLFADLRAAVDRGRLRAHGTHLVQSVPGAPRSVARLVRTLRERGVLLCLAPGVHVGTKSWRALPVWDRLLLTVAALAARSPATVFTGLTAAALHGLPVATTPADVHVRSAYAGHTGRRAAGTSRVVALPPKTPAPPGIRPHWSGVVVPGAAPVRLPIRLSTGDEVGQALADALPTVQLQLGALPDLRDAVPPLDALARRHPRAAEEWAAVHVDRLGSAAARERFAAAWAFADARAESAGESLSRVVIHELGFAAPVLQHTVRADSDFVGRVDFWWPDVRVVGEFDGITKYDVGLYTDDAERRRAIREERQREDALRRVVRDVARWTWQDLRAPAGLERELLQRGVPRR